jgi:hypothetical protein
MMRDYGTLPANVTPFHLIEDRRMSRDKSLLANEMRSRYF